MLHIAAPLDFAKNQTTLLSIHSYCVQVGECQNTGLIVGAGNAACRLPAPDADLNRKML